VECAEPISPARLRAMPAVQCQQVVGHRMRGLRPSRGRHFRPPGT
jgi:RNA polymerase-binding transcription factor DksA